MAGFRGTSTYDLFQLYFQIQDNTEVARKCFEISHCRVSMLVQLKGLVEAIMFCTSGLAAIGGLEVAFVAAVVHRSVVHRLPAAAWGGVSAGRRAGQPPDTNPNIFMKGNP